MKIEELEKKLTIEKLISFFEDNQDEVFPIKNYLEIEGEKNIIDNCLNGISVENVRALRYKMAKWREAGKISYIEIGKTRYYQLPHIIERIKEMQSAKTAHCNERI